MRLEIRHLGNGLPPQKSVSVPSYDVKKSKKFDPSASFSCSVLYIEKQGLVRSIAEYMYVRSSFLFR